VTDRPQRPPIHVRDKRFGSDQGGEKSPSSPGSPKPAVDVDLEEARAKIKELEDQLLRERADYANYKKRLVREQTELVERASLRIVERLLPVLDDLERALEAVRSHTDDEALLRGVELVSKHLHEVLTDEGLERVEAEGMFDPHEHEAVSSVPGDVHEATVLELVRPGYKLKGKTIRPALVHVSVPEGKPQAKEQDGSEQ
jgi:molecular chaperone GrpE